MATNKVLVKLDTQIRFFVTGSFSPAVANTNWTIGTPTDVVLTLNAVADAAARISTKFDFGATWQRAFQLLGCLDFTGETPSATGHVAYYLAPSTSATAATGNVAGGAGVDADAPDASMLGTITLSELLAQCQFLGNLPTHDGAVVQNGWVADFVPRSRWAQLIVVNNSGDVFEADDVEMHQVINPITDDIQAAA